MSSGFSGGNVGVNPPKNPVYAGGASTGAANDAVAYTVPAGRTFYCTGLNIACASVGSVIVKVNGVTLLSTDMATLEKLPFNGNPIFAATEAQTVTVRGASGAFYLSVWGYLL